MIQLNFMFTTAAGDVIITSKVIELLAHIHNKGSISAASKAADLSYKRTWDILDLLNSNLTHPAISTTVGGIDGGGTHLTHTGLEILAAYENMIRVCTPIIDDQVDIIKSHIK